MITVKFPNCLKQYHFNYEQIFTQSTEKNRQMNALSVMETMQYLFNILPALIRTVALQMTWRMQGLYTARDNRKAISKVQQT